MPNTTSAKKMVRKIERRSAINQSRRSRMRTFVRKVEEAIASGDQPGVAPCASLAQSAGPQTLIEVLTADDDDGNFATGTPNCLEILAAFDSHNINVDNLDIGLVCGGDSVPAGGRACAADLDTTSGPGVLDIFDYMAFQRLFVQRDPAACDCDTSDGPGVCDIFDFICFQTAFVAGCP